MGATPEEQEERRSYKNYSDIYADSKEDLEADMIGIRKGYYNPNKDCDKIIEAIYPGHIRY